MAASLKALFKVDTPDLRKINHVISRCMKFPKLQKTFFKSMVGIWSEDEDSRRLLAFINIMKALDCKPGCIGLCIKLMFHSYVRNSKFVVGSTIAHITFMRLSMVEVLSKNLDEAYRHAFVYIRQLAIGIRKAYGTNSKDAKPAIQNWQFLCSLMLWTDFVAGCSQRHQLIRSLIHPLVQLLVGLVKLTPGERWLPLRFHCIAMLHILAGVPALPPDSDQSSDPTAAAAAAAAVPLTGAALSPAHRLLVPSLPLLLDVFKMVNFNRRAPTPSRTSFDLRLLLHFSPSQRKETACLDAIVSWLFDLLTEAAAIHANSIAFPEFVHPLIHELKLFCHTCRVSSFTRQMKALQTKLREHAEWIAIRRRRLRNLANPEEIIQLETSFSSLNDPALISPFYAFYITHKRVRSNELAQLTASHQKDAIPDESVAGKLKPLKGLDEIDSTESDSDASYDVDDGTTVTHVSKKSNNVDPSALPDHTSDESDFDLKAALEEEDHEADDDLVASESAPDEVTEFELSDSAQEESDSDSPQGVSSSATSVHGKHKRKKFNGSHMIRHPAKRAKPHVNVKKRKVPSKKRLQRNHQKD